jgi:hypothetical protein
VKPGSRKTPRGTPGSSGFPFLTRGGSPFWLAAQAFPLDGLPESAAAFSVRRLRSAYTGPAVRVRRSADNVEADIGFTPAGDLDTSALLLHAGENLFVQSGDMLNAAWGATGVAKSAAGTSPSGQPAVFLDEAATNTNHYVAQPITWAATTPYVISFDVKAAGRGFAHFLFNMGVSLFAVNIDLATGVVASSNPPGTATATSLGDGWWRVDIGITTGAGGVQSAFVGGSSGLAMPRNGTYLGVAGTGILVSRPQLVNGSVARGYARTAGTAFAAQTGTVATWYDQSGNARHATQATSANQPRIVNAGVVEVDALARPALSFDGGDFLGTTLSPDRTAYPNLTVSAVYRTSDLTTFKALWGADNGGFDRGQLLGSAGSNWGLLAGNAAVSQAAILSTTAPVVYTATLRVGVANGSSVAANGVLNTALVEDLGSPHGTLGIGALNGGGQFSMFGFVREMVLLADALTTPQRQLLERNQGAYYGITVA